MKHWVYAFKRRSHEYCKHWGFLICLHACLPRHAVHPLRSSFHWLTLQMPITAGSRQHWSQETGTPIWAFPLGDRHPRSHSAALLLHLQHTWSKQRQDFIPGSLRCRIPKLWLTMPIPDFTSVLWSLVYLFERVTKREWKKDPLVHSSNSCHSQGWNQLQLSWSWVRSQELATRCFFWVSDEGAGVQGLDPSSLLSQPINKEQPGHKLPILDVGATGGGLICLSLHHPLTFLN